MEQDATRPLLTLREAGRIVGKDWRTVRDWARGGDVPNLSIEINGRVLIRRCVLEEMVHG